MRYKLTPLMKAEDMLRKARATSFRNPTAPNAKRVAFLFDRVRRLKATFYK